jgi:hypothetical protein
MKEKNSRQILNQTKLALVSPSSWGAVGISFIIGENDVEIEYDCASGKIEQRLMMNEQGSFSADGVYIRQYPGAIRLKLLPKRQPARYEGTISGHTMTLKTTLTETNEILGEVVLERNKTPRIHKCY